MRRRRTDPAILRARYDAAARLVEVHAASRARAGARLLGEPHDREAYAQLETAEQLHYLAVYELRRARRALRRRERFDAVLARCTLNLLPARARRR